MDNNNDDKAKSEGEEQLEFDVPADPGRTPSWERREPLAAEFDTDEYEEPDRDTDSASIYTEVDEQEDIDSYAEEPAFIEEDFDEEDFDEEADDSDALDLWQTEDSATPEQDEELESLNAWDEPPREPEEDTDSIWGVVPPPEDPAAASTIEQAPDDNIPDETDDWAEEEEYLEQELQEQATWPLGLIIVAIIALLLLGAGGYGVMQQRAAMQEEIRQLRASLATAAQPAEVAASRSAAQEATQRNRELQTTVDNLTLENRSLRDTVAGLESQLQAQQEALSKPTPKPTPVPEPEAAAKATPTKPAQPPSQTKKQSGTPYNAASSGGGDWFVNFGSYSKRDTAESWISRLQPPSGRVVVTTGSRDGRTFYRVRVVDLASRESAETIARQLEKDYSLGKLWVGKQ